MRSSFYKITFLVGPVDGNYLVNLCFLKMIDKEQCLRFKFKDQYRELKDFLHSLNKRLFHHVLCL